MESPAEILGNETISLPGQNLTDTERKYLVYLADGNGTNTIIEKTGLNQITARQVQRSIQNKLGAKTIAHIISRSFVLNILIPRCICIIMAFLSNGIVNDHQLRVSASGRNSTSIAKVAKSSKTSNYA